MSVNAGHEAVSDPVDLATTTETDLVISTYHATPCEPATCTKPVQSSVR